MTRNLRNWLYTLLAALALAGCASGGYHGAGYGGSPALPEGYGVVQSTEMVTAPREINWPAAILGGVVGGVLGHQIGGGTGQAVATGVGAVGGAMVGQKLGERPPATLARLNVRMDDGSYRVAYTEPEQNLQRGERVFVSGDRATRR